MNRVGFHGTHETQPSRMVYLDSLDCTQFTNLTSHYLFGFKDAIETGPNEGMLVSLSSASIPYSFYNIRLNINDTLHYNSTLSITIPPGNYSANNLGKEIVRLFKAAGIVMTATYDRVTQKYTFQTDQPSTALKFHFEEDKENSIKNELGFVGFGGATVQDAQGSFTSTSAADLNGSVHAIYVRTNLATRSVMESQTGGVSDILAKIDINTDPGGVITLEPQQVSHEALIHTAGVKHIEVRITDERNRLLDLNGLHSQIGLRFRFVTTKPSDPIPLGDPRQRVNPKDVPALKQKSSSPSKKKKT
eukprot:COSAG02_NODE_2836_length_7923_cov_152.700153_3_plen_304_part_00